MPLLAAQHHSGIGRQQLEQFEFAYRQVYELVVTVNLVALGVDTQMLKLKHLRVRRTASAS